MFPTQKVLAQANCPVFIQNSFTIENQNILPFCTPISITSTSTNSSEVTRDLFVRISFGTSAGGYDFLRSFNYTGTPELLGTDFVTLALNYKRFTLRVPQVAGLATVTNTFNFSLDPINFGLSSDYEIRVEYFTTLPDCPPIIVTESFITIDPLLWETPISGTVTSLIAGGRLLPNSGSSPLIELKTIHGVLDVNTDYTFKSLTSARAILYLGPGSEIIVRPGVTLTLTNVDLFTCDKLAQGITVETGGTLIVSGCTLNDSRFAVDAKPGSTISITGTGFFDNYIGLRLNMSGVPESQKRVMINALTNNTFSTAQTAINAPFPGMPEAVEARGYCGILVNDFNDFNVFASPGNSFSFLANGLILSNTTGNISRMFFNDMNSVGPAAYPMEGFGIRMGAKGKPSYMNINDFGQAMTFNNCKTGIRADYYHGDVENVTMTNVGIGIDWVNSPGRLIKLDGNTISARQEGIRSFMNEPTMAASLIRANTITMTNSSPAALNPRTGIELQEGSFGANLGAGWRVLGNTVTMSNGGQGILYRNGLFGNVVGNAVNNTGATANSQNPYTGIQTEGNVFANVAANTVDQSLAAGLGQGDSEGIYSASGFANTYQCNCVNRTAVGMQFNDMADFTNAVRGNRMNTHNTLGLQLGFPGGGAFVGRQVHTGNLWDLTVIPPGGFGGRNFGDILLSQFFVNPGPEHPAVAPQQWFQDVSASSFTCSNACAFPPGAQIPPRVPEDYVPTGLDGASVNGTIGTGSYYPTETLWKGKYRLYRKMLRIPAIENYSSQYTAFKSANMNLPLGKLAYISEEKAKLYTLSSTEQSTLDAYWADLTSKISTLRNLDSLRQSGASIDPAVYNTAVQQRITSGTQYQTYQQGLTTARQQKIQTLLTFNAGTSTGPIIEANHKTVNQIVLQMLLVDSLASSSLTALTAIAAQCPLSGGDAVYEARSIVARLTGQEYDDVALCGSQRPGAGGRDETSEIPMEVIVFPNPTTGQITWIGLEGQTVTVRVFNQLGQMVAERHTADNSLDLGALSEGVYHLQFSNLEQTMLLNKSIVIEKR